MNTLTVKELRKKFKEKYIEEFNDPNESFMDFLLDLIPKEILIHILEKGKTYYSVFYKYK